MATLKNTIPSGMRSPIETGRFSQGLIGRTVRSLPAGTAFKNCFPALPDEPEDARLTGATRSLNRRLLGLNLRVPVVAS